MNLNSIRPSHDCRGRPGTAGSISRRSVSGASLQVLGPAVAVARPVTGGGRSQERPGPAGPGRRPSMIRLPDQLRFESEPLPSSWQRRCKVAVRILRHGPSRFRRTLRECVCRERPPQTDRLSSFEKPENRRFPRSFGWRWNARRRKKKIYHSATKIKYHIFYLI